MKSDQWVKMTVWSKGLKTSSDRILLWKTVVDSLLKVSYKTFNSLPPIPGKMTRPLGCILIKRLKNRCAFNYCLAGKKTPLVMELTRSATLGGRTVIPIYQLWGMNCARGLKFCPVWACTDITGQDGHHGHRRAFTAGDLLCNDLDKWTHHNPTCSTMPSTS